MPRYSCGRARKATGNSMRVFLIAGEASGDKLGGALMSGLNSLCAANQYAGIGADLMEAQGLQSLFPMSDLSVMGLAEIIPRYPHLRRRLLQTVEAVNAFKPDVLITIDSPDFSLRVAKRVKRLLPDLPVVHYVAPSVWAWRAGRAARMAKYVDHVLALLPFEPPLMRAAGMSCDFVGHPVVSEALASADSVNGLRDKYGLDAPVLLLLAGSRRGELARLGARFAETANLVKAEVPDLKILLPTLPHLAADAGAIAQLCGGIVVTDPAERRAGFAIADLALAASGTVSLELAANRTPMVIGYDMAPVSRWLIGKLLKVKTVTLVNLVSETRIIPEFLGRDCDPELMAPTLIELLQSPAASGQQQKIMTEVMERLGAGGEPPGLRAAKSVLGFLAAQDA